MTPAMQLRSELSDHEEPHSAGADLVDNDIGRTVLGQRDLSLCARFYPLGYPVELKTNSPEILEMARECWSPFRPRFATPPIQMRFTVLEDDEPECPPAPVCRLQGNLLCNIADAGNFSVNDLNAGSSAIWLTSGAMTHQNYVRYFFVEYAPYAHIVGRHAAGIHAACVELNGVGAMLCGASGAGKSTLAYACARAGWTYITDDGSYMPHDSNDRLVIGNSHTVRFRPSAKSLFPELEGKELTPRAAGKPSIELPTSSIGGIATSQTSNVEYLILLNRFEPDAAAPEEPTLTPVAKDDARRYFQDAFYGTPQAMAMQRATVEKLLGAPALELRYSELQPAIDLLTELTKAYQ